jgi:hypothetical protein
MNKNLKPITLVVLIDFHGHPVLAPDEEMNVLRYNALKRLAFGPPADIAYICNVPDFNKTPKLIEIETLVGLDGRNPWYNIDPDDKNIDTHYIDRMLAKDGYRIENVIVGGCNTAGCVTWTKPYGAIHWGKRGYQTKVWLPLCGEYQMAGHTTAECNMIAMEMMYEYIVDAEVTKQVKIVANPFRLDIKYRD